MTDEYHLDNVYDDLGTFTHTDGKEAVNAGLRIIRFIIEELDFMNNYNPETAEEETK